MTTTLTTPPFLYGTAWKEDDTERLTRLALEAGFRGIDTANQRKHYHEAGVGAALRRALSDGIVTRDQLFLQTKFTSPGGQDHRLPYDRNADPATQVRQSFARSLEHLGTDRLDAFVLHGPEQRVGLTAYDLAVWGAIERLGEEGRTRHVGVSNVSLEQLRALCDRARVPPRIVQNRCYARTGWDREVRAFCRAHDIVYQGFSLLTANVRELSGRAFGEIVRRVGATPAQVVFRFAQQVGMLPLTGTRGTAHMREDLACAQWTLAPDDLSRIEQLA